MTPIKTANIKFKAEKNLAKWALTCYGTDVMHSATQSVNIYIQCSPSQFAPLAPYRLANPLED
jgi:hypothetical protein